MRGNEEFFLTVLIYVNKVTAFLVCFLFITKFFVTLRWRPLFLCSCFTMYELSQCLKNSFDLSSNTNLNWFRTDSLFTTHIYHYLRPIDLVYEYYISILFNLYNLINYFKNVKTHVSYTYLYNVSFILYEFFSLYNTIRFEQ